MQTQFQPLYQGYPPMPTRYKNVALALIITAWVLGIMGLMFDCTGIGLLIGIPLGVIAFIAHIIGIVFLAMIQER